MNESKLFRRDVTREDRFKSVGYSIGYDLVKAVIERNGSKVIERRGGVKFGDKGNESGLYNLVQLP